MGSRVIFWVGEPPQKFFSKSEGVGEIMLFYFNFDQQKDNFEKLPLNPDSSQVTVNEPQLNKRENKFDEILREVKLHKQF